MTSLPLISTSASKPIIFRWSSRSNPVITEITIINTLIPSTTPRIEIRVISDRNVRFGFRYRSARKQVNGNRILLGTGRETGSAILSVKESAIKLQPRENDNIANGRIERLAFLFNKRFGQEKRDDPEQGKQNEISTEPIDLEKPDRKLVFTQSIEKNAPENRREPEAERSENREKRKEVVPAHHRHGIHRDSGVGD